LARQLWSILRTAHQEEAMTDEQQIRDLIERWAAAARDGDLAAVLAHHAPGIVMFDVPPPQAGVRGTRGRGGQSSTGA
jgi:ketosteroid isomerase-like protein